jgi:hypothetical protein
MRVVVPEHVAVEDRLIHEQKKAEDRQIQDCVAPA